MKEWKRIRDGHRLHFSEEATMAESESLNLNRARRWQPVLQAAGDGTSADHLIVLARRCLYRTLRAVRKQVPFDALLVAACNCPDALPDLIRECKQGRDYARLFQRVAEKGATREALLAAYLREVCSSFLNQIHSRIACRRAFVESPAETRERLDGVRDALDGDYRRIATNLAADPEWKIAMPRSPRRSRAEQAQELLGQSLLAGCVS
jgi:hypothetical protein